ncbi:MAG TPA: purine nucleoside permease [Candidatus Lustribacter sp.]|jgi:purine nucleoside permease|nr:purine nucleoside permease [Candidatus Lustribacter sp.]
MLLALLALVTVAPVSSAAIAPRVLIVATFPFEAERWIARDRLSRRIPIAGLPAPLACNDAQTECLLTTGMGKVNAAASIVLAGASGRLDMRTSYILLAGIAGTTPEVASIGSVAWARWVVDGGLARETDPREPLVAERFSRSALGFRTGTEVFALDAALAKWAYAETRSLPLRDSASARRYRAHYRDTKFGNAPPMVLACDVISDDTFWQGAIMSAFARAWVANWTRGRGTYCMSAMEDSGFLGGLARLTARGRANLARVLILRGASDYDRPYSGQTPAQSQAAMSVSGGPELAAENVYLAGEQVVRRLIRKAAGDFTDPLQP